MNKQILTKIVLAGLFLIPFTPLLVSSSLFFPFITTKAFAFRIIIEIVFAAWILLALIRPEYRPKKSWLSWALLAFAVIIGLADLFGASGVKSFWSNYERMEGFITLLHLGMFFLVLSSVLTEKLWHRWFQTSLGAAVILSIYSFFQLAGTLAINQGGARVDGTLGNAAYLAVFMLFHIFFALYLLLTEKNLVMRYVYGGLALVFTSILYMTATRGAILGLLGGLLVAALLSVTDKENKRLRKFAISYLVILALIVGGFATFKDSSFVKNSQVLSRFSNLNASSIKTEGRAFVWPIALKGIKERPILGWGQENFNYVFNTNYSPEMYRIEQWFDRAHNIFLDWGIAGGILGLLSYLSLYGISIFYIWSKNVFERGEKAILTGLLSAYFFHNLFVFDHLVSYILFTTLLGFIHFRVVSKEPVVDTKGVEESKVQSLGLPLVLIGLLAVLYFGSISPLRANMSLITALKGLQSQDYKLAASSFEEAYERSRLGRPEVVEQIAGNATTILNSPALSTEEKTEFYNFAQSVVKGQADKLATDARYQILAGSFLGRAGDLDGALVYLKRAQLLTPGKQVVYFELANVYINKKDAQSALKELETAYNLAPKYLEAVITYLAGAIYAGEKELEAKLIEELRVQSPNFLLDDRVLNAYVLANRTTEVVAILEEKIRRSPTDPQNYATLASFYLKAGNKTLAIQVLKKLAETNPQFKTEVENYIKGIENGTIK